MLDLCTYTTIFKIFLCFFLFSFLFSLLSLPFLLFPFSLSSTHSFFKTDRVFLYSPACPGTYFVNQTGLKVTEVHLPLHLPLYLAKMFKLLFTVYSKNLFITYFSHCCIPNKRNLLRDGFILAHSLGYSSSWQLEQI